MTNDTISLDRVASNMYSVSVGRLKIYYSYKTPIAFECGYGLTIRKNEWKQTTGKHLNIIDRDHSKRIDGVEFLERLQDILEGYGLDKRLATME